MSRYSTLFDMQNFRTHNHRLFNFSGDCLLVCPIFCTYFTNHCQIYRQFPKKGEGWHSQLGTSLQTKLNILTNKQVNKILQCRSIVRDCARWFGCYSKPWQKLRFRVKKNSKCSGYQQQKDEIKKSPLYIACEAQICHQRAVTNACTNENAVSS